LLVCALYFAWAEPAAPAQQQVEVTADGLTLQVQCSGTVAEALAAAGVLLQPLDRVQPAPSTPVKAGMHIVVTRVSKSRVRKLQRLPAPVVYKDTTSLRPGQVKVESEGAPGLLAKDYEIWTRNGKVTLEKVVASTVLVAPKPRVVLRGARLTLTSRSGFRGRRTLRMIATAYTDDPRENSGYTITATGLKVRKGIAAVDPRVIPLGTLLYVEGYGFALAADTGGAIKGNRIDLCFPTRAECKRFGRRTVIVHVLE